ncbi:hypothetical protein ACM64Y_01795 [Novispirillum sp. DQ9]|uniref:hypothetical protein n=1 Tax=Novispirillum sp. DQ9 TaxID=3398612 RepID=UPI003C7B8ED7
MCEEPSGALPTGAGLGEPGDLFDELPGLGNGRLIKPVEEWEETLQDKLADVLDRRGQQWSSFKAHGYVAWFQARASVGACPDIVIPAGRFTIPVNLPCDLWPVLQWLAVLAAAMTILGAILRSRA